MQTITNYFRFYCIVLALAVLPGLAGCGDGSSKNQSTDEFLESLDLDGKPGEILESSLPPIGESMDNAGKIRLETEEFDMGVIRNDELAHAKIKVYNDGGLPLKITDISTTCACTMGTVTPENAVVPGGAESWIDVVVDPRRITGFHSKKKLTIVSTDPKNRFVHVDVVANVDPEYDIGPDEIDLGQLPKGENFEKRIRFRQAGAETVNIEELTPLLPGVLKSGDPGFTVAIEDVPDTDWQESGRHEYDLVFNFTPTMPAGPFTRYAKLTTDIKRIKNHRLTFTGTIAAPYAALPLYPERAELQRGGGEGPYTARITITAAEAMTVGAITPEDDTLQAVFTSGGLPNIAHIDVSYAGEAPAVGRFFDKYLDAELTIGGKTYTERIGVYINPAPGAGSVVGNLAGGSQ
jgi:hypothetical protein